MVITLLFCNVYVAATGQQKHQMQFRSNNNHLGVIKTPVAGRGPGNSAYDIVPGAPDKSILLYQMKTNAPAIAMTEIGVNRSTAKALHSLRSGSKQVHFFEQLT